MTFLYFWCFLSHLFSFSLSLIFFNLKILKSLRIFLHLFLCVLFPLSFSPCSKSLIYINLLYLCLFNSAFLFFLFFIFLTVFVSLSCFLCFFLEYTVHLQLFGFKTVYKTAEMYYNYLIKRVSVPSR